MSEKFESPRDTSPPATVEVVLDGRCMSSLLDESERKILAWAMTQTQGNQRKAAEKLGISYSAMKMKVARHNLRATWT